MRLRTCHPAKKALQTGRAGFSLLEVLVVVAIIVMLAGVGGYYVMQRYEDAKEGRAKTDVRGLAGQLEQYSLANGGYPGSIEELAAPQPNGGSPLTRQDALIDPWGKMYQFSPPDGASTFEATVFTTTPKGKMISSAQMAK
jgi:general secretion pathway protein G